MADHWLFFLDADGWLVGPESEAVPDEARILNAALTALYSAETASEPQVSLLAPERDLRLAPMALRRTDEGNRNAS